MVIFFFLQTRQIPAKQIFWCLAFSLPRNHSQVLPRGFSECSTVGTPQGLAFLNLELLLKSYCQQIYACSLPSRSHLETCLLTSDNHSKRGPLRPATSQHLWACLKCRNSGPTPEQLNQKLLCNESPRWRLCTIFWSTVQIYFNNDWKKTYPGALELEKGTSGDAKFCPKEQNYVINRNLYKKDLEIGYTWALPYLSLSKFHYLRDSLPHLNSRPSFGKSHGQP